MKPYNSPPGANDIILAEEFPRFPEDIGKQFDYLKVEYQIEMPYPQPIFYMCTCKCGKEVIRNRGNIYRNAVQSCGCYRDAYMKSRVSPALKHGGAKRDKKGRKEKLYRTWVAMRNRCNNQNNKRYDSYGGRGIKVCKEWDDYDNFHKWAKKNGYKKNLTIERIDNDKGYSPDNCKWATNLEQQKNTTLTSYFIIDGRKIIQADLARELGVYTSTVKQWAINGKLKYEYWNKGGCNNGV